MSSEKQQRNSLVQQAAEQRLPRCSYCDSSAGDPCRTLGGQTTKPHSARRQATEVVRPVEPNVVVQCKSCPWKVGCVPDTDIPRYDESLHQNLAGTIAPGAGGFLPGPLRIMACHHSKTGEEFACAGWLENQLGPGNNIGLRMSVLSGRTPVPKTSGPQHEHFEDTLPVRCSRTAKGK